MKIIPCKIGDVKYIENTCAVDNRGCFIKTFNKEVYNWNGLNVDIKESFYSISNKNVIRGMHFQLPPYEHDKLVHVISGSVMDVVVDLRKDSPTYKQSMSIHLCARNGGSLYIPKGFAHGFKSLEDNTIMLYQVTCGYHAESDTGIAYDSIGVDWEVDNPILSERDASFITLTEFKSPF